MQPLNDQRSSSTAIDERTSERQDRSLISYVGGAFVAHQGVAHAQFDFSWYLAVAEWRSVCYFARDG